jgi:hypothetical protein
VKKKILIGLGVLVVLLGSAAAWLTLVGNKRSPKDSVTHNDITVTYCRPYKKGRVIFGGEGALQPNGKYWRLGANAATEITFAKDILFGGKPVQAGMYVMYAVPGENTWKIALNSENGRWGAREVDHSKDVMSFEVPVERVAQPLEQFTITIDDYGVNMAWDTIRVRAPVGHSKGS